MGLPHLHFSDTFAEYTNAKLIICADSIKKNGVPLSHFKGPLGKAAYRSISWQTYRIARSFLDEG